MVTQKDSFEVKAEDVEMPPEHPASALTHPCWGILWLVVGHIVVGVVAALVANLGSGPTLPGAVFHGLVFSQTNLLGIWGGLGTSNWRRRLTGVILGVIYLSLLTGLSTGDSHFVAVVAIQAFVIMAMTTAFVAMLLLIVRLFRVVIRLDSSPFASAGRIQFSIRHLLILTFLIACFVTIGKITQPYFPPGEWFFQGSLLVVAIGVIGIAPVWFVLSSQHPILYGIGLVAAGACAGYCLGRAFFRDEEIWMTVTATEAISVVVSLLVVRFCGYRLMRLPPRRLKENIA